MKCPILKEENTTARCDGVSRLLENKGVFYCPKDKKQYKVNNECWDVDEDYCERLNGK